jgi:hypothetical protein
MPSELSIRVRNYGERHPALICYWKHEGSGEWYIHFPTEDGDGLLGGLANHTVVEHEDGTISVTPSIQTTGHNGQRHGYLTKGVWNEC